MEIDVAELLSNNDVVHASFWLSWVCLGLIALLMFHIGEEASLRNTILTLLMPVDILFGTACAYLGSGTLTSEQAQIICIVVAISAAAVTVLGVIWRSTTTVGLAAIGFEFAIISLRLFGGYTAQIMSAFIILIAFMHGLKKYREQLNSERQNRRMSAYGDRLQRGRKHRRDGYRREPSEWDSDRYMEGFDAEGNDSGLFLSESGWEEDDSWEGRN